MIKSDAKSWSVEASCATCGECHRLFAAVFPPAVFPPAIFLHFHQLTSPLANFLTLHSAPQTQRQLTLSLQTNYLDKQSLLKRFSRFIGSRARSFPKVNTDWSLLDFRFARSKGHSTLGELFFRFGRQTLAAIGGVSRRASLVPVCNSEISCRDQMRTPMPDRRTLDDRN